MSGFDPFGAPAPAPPPSEGGFDPFGSSAAPPTGQQQQTSPRGFSSSTGFDDFRSMSSALPPRNPPQATGPDPNSGFGNFFDGGSGQQQQVRAVP